MANQEQNRTCLKCNKEFSSRGPHNRICGHCTYQNKKVKMGKQPADDGHRIPLLRST